MEKVFNFTEKQKKTIKRNWLISAILFQLVIPFIINFLSFYNSINEDFKIKFFGGVLILIFYLLFFLFIFHCAYRNHGTRLLTFWLIITPFVWLNHFLESIMITHLSIAVIIFESIIFIWWYRNCLHLRRLNKELKRFKTLVN